jgi:hypothetical protein
MVLFPNPQAINVVDGVVANSRRSQHSLIHPRFCSRRRITHPGE